MAPLSAKQFVAAVVAGSLSVEEHTAAILEEADRVDRQAHYFNVLAREAALNAAREIDKKIKVGKGKELGKLAGLPLSVKDCIVVEGIESTAGSAILKGFVPPYTATAVSRSQAEGAIVLGKTSQDEFGFGSFSVNVGLGFRVPLNPHDSARSCGGSSGGAAGWTAATSHAHIALAESTGGSIVGPAAFCGVVGLCPTYGLVSRYGLIDYASSLDKIGPIAKSVEDAALCLEVIAGHDPNDSTSLPGHDLRFLPYLGADCSGLKLGLIKEAFGEGIDPEMASALLDRLTATAIETKEISLPLTARYAIPTYYILATAEASTNLARYCGMRYGSQPKLEGWYNDYFASVRSAYLGKEAKRRIILGTFARMAGFREAYYIRAAKVRTAIIKEYAAALKECDALISPTMPFIAPRFDELSQLSPLQNYLADILTVGPNLAGLPHLSVPIARVKGMPAGLMVIAAHQNEGLLVSLGSTLERVSRWKAQK